MSLKYEPASEPLHISVFPLGSESHLDNGRYEVLCLGLGKSELLVPRGQAILRPPVRFQHILVRLI